MKNIKWEEKRKADMCLIWFHEFYDPNDLEKQNQIISALRINKFQKPEQSDINEALLMWF
jgi:hypothetical protein